MGKCIPSNLRKYTLHLCKNSRWELLVSISNPQGLPGVNFTCCLLVPRGLTQGSLGSKQETGRNRIRRGPLVPRVFFFFSISPLLSVEWTSGRKMLPFTRSLTKNGQMPSCLWCKASPCCSFLWDRNKLTWRQMHYQTHEVMDERFHLRGSSVTRWQVHKDCGPAVCPSLPLYSPGETWEEGPALPGVKRARWQPHTSVVPARTGPTAVSLCLCHVTRLCLQDSLGNMGWGGDFCFFLCLYHILFSYSAADTVSLVLLTSIWLPIPSHKARWNYNPTLFECGYLLVLGILSVLW